MKSYVVQYKTTDGDLESKVVTKEEAITLIKHGDNLQVVSVFSFDDQNALVRLQHRMTDLFEVKYHEVREPSTGLLEFTCFSK